MMKITYVFVALLCLMLMSSCAKKAEVPDSVAAVVNDQPILKAEVDFIFNQQKIPGESEEGAQNRRRAILGDLVRVELLAQYALSQNYDDKDEIVIQEKLARRQILASLAGKNHGQALPALTPDAARKVIDSNPLVFRERKLLNLDTLELITPDEGLFKRLDLEGQRGVSLDRLQELAVEANATTTRGVRSIGTDQLPPIVAKALLEGKPDVPVIVKGSKNRGVVLVLRTSVPAPVSDEVAEKIVASDLSGRIRREGLAKLIEQRLADSRVEYKGIYAESAEIQTKAEASISYPLPLPRTDTKRRIFFLSIAVAGLMALSVALAIQTISWTARWFRGHFWIPRLGFLGLRPIPVSDLDPVNSTLLPSLLSKISFVPLLLMSTISISALIYLGVKHVSLWFTIAGISLGVIMGGLLLKWLMASKLRQISQQVRWWPPVTFAFVQWGVAAAGVFVLMMI